MATSSSEPGTRLERRAYRRAPLDRPVLIDAASASQPARARDVSGGGISVSSGLSLTIGNIVEVYFELPIGFAVEARAEVIRTEDGTTARRFLDLDKEAVVALRSYCRISGLHRLENAAPASR